MKSIPFLLFLSLVIFLSVSCGGNKDAGEKSAEKTGADASTVVLNQAEANEQLRLAALDGKLEDMEEALKAGADVNAPDPEGRTALMFAGFNGHSEIVLALLDAGAGIDRRDVMGRTALLYTCTGPFPEAVSILLDRGAEPNVIDSNENFSPLMHAAAEGNLDVVKILLEADADHTKCDVDGDNAESFARQGGHIEVADYLRGLK